ncbi:rhamnosyl/mannosyltransferase [Thiothrix eikelboomii]|uniref:Rhamnosyl/mannosyltransferase n=1 Tax=Thiothrix eikelboomii TaxID=92487 RepID=A0A1T4XL11_9GAMM|nr:glycosyltransferase [Thiothrix eikelboomii]SKA90083.1 rhamnosyl/mannosyltransferase [Thiothrix eikelboomii]
MKILCFGRFYDKFPGGIQTHIAHLFAALNNKVEFVHLVPSRDFTKAQLSLHGYPVIRTPSLNIDGSLAISPTLVTEAIKLHKKYQFDLIHLHFPDPMSHLASLALPSDIPRIISWHADITRQKILKHFYHPLLNKAINQAATIVVATPAHITSSPELSHLHENKLSIIHYGFDLNRFLKSHPKTEKIKNQFPGLRIFALGRHVYYKGFDILIRAVHQLPVDTQILIGGLGPLTEIWKKLAASEGLHERIHFLGLVPDEVLLAYYQACDIFCLPATSSAEAFGIVQVEAMAAGKPIVSTRLNNGVDFVNQHGTTGLTVEPNNVNALADGLNKLLANPILRQQLGEQARYRAINDFSLETMGQKTFELYQQVIIENKKP